MPDRGLTQWNDLVSTVIDTRKEFRAERDIYRQAGRYAEALSLAVGYAGCIIYIIVDDGAALLLPSGIHPDFRDSDYAADMPLMKHLELTRRSILCAADQCLKSDIFPGDKPFSLLCSPVIVRERVRGFIYISSSEPNVLTHESLMMADLISDELAAAVEILSLQSSLDAATVTDELTGCFNRKKFNEDIEVEIPCSERYGRALSLVKISIDLIKNYTDAYGTARGDELIRKTGETLSYSIRMCDRLYRFGKEEFIITLPGLEKDRGVFTAQRLQKVLGQIRFEGEADRQPGGKITYSTGVASFPVDAVFTEGLMKKLDAALKSAKESGGNAVVAL